MSAHIAYDLAETYYFNIVFTPGSSLMPLNSSTKAASRYSSSLHVRSEAAAGGLGLFRRFVASVLASAVFATSVVPASADRFIFRHKYPVSWSIPQEGNEEEQLGVGNDITVYFTGAIGQQFSKLIPVTTLDVVEWKVLSGSLQPGLELDTSAGVVSGVATGSTTSHKAVLIGFDYLGKMIARATITFRFHNPVGRPKAMVFYGHTNKYMYRQIPASVPVDRWEALTELPDDFHTEGRFLAGTPRSEYQTGVAFVGYDYTDKEVAFAFGDILVQDQPVVGHIADQSRHPSNGFSINPSVQHKIGELTWRLVALDGKPSNLGINSKTGHLSGRIPTFNTALRFRIEALDVDGTVGSSNIFTLSTSGPDTDISKFKDQQATIGTAYSVKLTGGDLSGQMTWQVVAGSLPRGINLNPETGELFGTPTKEEIQDGIIIAVNTSDGGQSQTQPFKFTVYPEDIRVTFTPVDVRVGKSFTTAGPTFGTGIIAPYGFAPVAGANVNDDLAVAYETAVVSGLVDAAGDYSVPFKFLNGDGHEKVVTQPIAAYDPLTLLYPDVVTLYRRVPASVSPLSELGVVGQGVRVLASGELPSGISVDPNTGNIIGTPTTIDDATDISIRLSDETGEKVVSNVFDIEIVDRPNVSVDVGITQVERYVENAVIAATATNAFDGVTFELVNGVLPDGLSLDEDGVIRGSTTEPAGVYEGFRVRATDGEGYSALTPFFTITVTAPQSLKPLEQADAGARWTKGVPFNLTLPRPSNAFGTVSYDLQGLPAGVSVIEDALVGKITAAGTYTFPLTLTDNTGRTLFGTYTLVIIEPMTGLLDGPGKRIGADADEIFFDLPRGSDVTIKPILKNAIEPVAFEFKGELPEGLFYANGTVSGNPLRKDQTGSVIVMVRDAAGTSVELSASLFVVERLPISLSYDIDFPVGYVDTKMTPIKPTVQNAVGRVTYSVSGILPPGVTFDDATGMFSGIPTKDGNYGNIVVTATDADGGSSYHGSYGPFPIGIGLPGSVRVPENIYFTVRAGNSFERTIDISNVTFPLEFRPVGNALDYGLVLGASDGKISGLLPSEGKYAVGSIIVTDALNRTKTTSVTITAVGPLSVQPPATIAFNQYSEVSARTRASNAVGTTTYQLVSGALPSGLTLNTATGLITGEAKVKASASGLVIQVTDSTGETARTSPFTLTVGDRLPLAMNTVDSYGAVANKAFKLTLPVENAVGQVQFVQTGGLPDGITFDGVHGVFFGLATSIGTFPLTVSVTDSVGETVKRSFSIIAETNGQPINLTLTDFATKVGYPIRTAPPKWSNHVGVVRLWADETLAEYGLAIDTATGVISGTATQTMNITLNVHITDVSNRVTSKPINIRVVPDLSVNAPEIINLPVNKTIDPYIRPTADYATGSVEWSISGTLPKGLVFSRYYHRFSGKPTEMGTVDVSVTAREKDGFQQVASSNIKINVINNGVAPSVSFTPLATGYSTSGTSTLTPTYKNAKVGDVLTLAPGSAPLPPGMTIEKNTSGVNVLKKGAVNENDVGIYRNILLRVTDVDGLYGETEPFTIIYKSSLVYPRVDISTRTMAPVSVPVPTPTSGRPTGDVTFSLQNDFSNGTLSINPATGEITGYIEKSGTVTVQVTEKCDGVVLRHVSYSAVFKALVLSVSVTENMVTYTGMDFPFFETKITNGIPEGSLSILGTLPSGLTFDKNTGVFSGKASAAGVYPLTLRYSDPYQTISKSVTVVVEQAAAGGAGYKFVKLGVTGGYGHIFNYVVHSAGGHNIMHIMKTGEGTISNAVLATLLGPIHKIDMDFANGKEQAFDFPVLVTNGSVTFEGHGSGSVTISVSEDGENWKVAGIVPLKGGIDDYEVKFKYIPPIADEPVEVSKIAAGDDFTCALKANGTTWCWGGNAFGQLGSGNTTSSKTPKQITSLGSNVTTLAGYGSRACALSSDGSMWCWGGVSSFWKTPTIIPSVSNASMVTIASLYGYALKKDGSVWGKIYVGNGTSATQIGGLNSDVISISGARYGNDFLCAIKRDRTVWCVGDGSQGNLGNGAAEKVSVPTMVQDFRDVKSISVGLKHTCAVKTDGSLWCWGRNTYGQLGTGDTTDYLRPVKITALSDVASVSASDTHTCAVKTNGSLYCWGRNNYGQIGIGSGQTGNQIVPMAVSGMSSGVNSVTLGQYHSCAAKKDNTLWCWGYNNMGQIGNNATTEQLTPVKIF